MRCRLTLASQRKQFSTGIFINPLHWSQEQQKLLDTGENFRIVNSQISLIEQKLGLAFLMLQIQEESFDVEDIYKIYSGENAKNEMGVMAVYEEHNTYYKKLIGKGLCELKINLTHHIARKTFATTVLLLNDVPIEIVSKLLGHSRIGITQAHYGIILEDKVGKVMEVLYLKLDQ